MQCRKCGGDVNNAFRGCARCRHKKLRRDFWYGVAAVVFLIAASLGVKACHADWAYDDWTCAFKNCRVVK